MTRTEMLEAMHECIEWAEAYEAEAYDVDEIMAEVAEADVFGMMELPNDEAERMVLYA